MLVQPRPPLTPWIRLRSLGADETYAGAVQSARRRTDVCCGVRRWICWSRLSACVGYASAVGQRDAVRCGHVCVEYGRLLPVRDADRIHGDRFVAASPGAAGCQPWRWARLARRAFDDVRRDAGNDGRSGTSGISPVRLAILREILQAVCSLPPPAWF